MTHARGIGRRRLFALMVSAVAATAVVASVMVYVLAIRASDALAGPTTETITGLTMDVDDVATWGMLLVWNTGDSPIVLEDLPLNPDQDTSQVQDPIEVQRLQVVPTESLKGETTIGMSAGAGEKVIPEAKRSPLAGYELAPGVRVSVLVQYRALKEGAWKYDTVTMAYKEGRRSGSLTLTQGLSVCAPSDKPCPFD
ncbi:hypothetical protein LWF15_19820 [Kineosporia rhizophila]|uniref:hypothetical protein n=1 Tax=Kineosporia rhizophila TaxID=84633 RepID=UPI001E5D0C9E|nr:hypothetical protein [Kineosporia rhizophila]MCE0537744.1 hypothetical protein [Kineosporia rhizophila]